MYPLIRSRSIRVTHFSSIQFTTDAGEYDNFADDTDNLYGVAYDHSGGRGVHGTIIVRILGICGVMGVISSMGGSKRTTPTELPFVLVSVEEFRQCSCWLCLGYRSEPPVLL